MPTESSTTRPKNPADYVVGFSSYREAEKAGYFSLKRLKEMGLSVPDSMRPYYRAMVETHYGRNCVYSQEQCKAIKPGKTEDQSLLLLPVTDRQGIGNASITTDSCCCNVLTATFLCDKYDPKAHRQVYCPENFDPEGLPQELLPYRAEMVRLFHVLHLLGIEQQRKAHEFKRAKRDYLANQMPQLRKWLNRSVELGYVERDEHWQAGKFSMGYRVGKKWQVTHRSRIVELSETEKRKDRRKSKFRLPVLETLIRNVGTIGLEGTPGFDDELEAMEKEKLETHAVYNERDGFGWRFHSCISNVRREWRYCYRVNGRALHMSDVANSQPLVLASVLRERGVQGCDEYVRLCEDGTIYDVAAKDVGTSRQEAKDGIIHHAFYGRNGYGGKPYRTKWHRWLRDRFPTVAGFVRDVKRTDHARLSRMLQRQESKIVLYTACESLVLEEDVFLAPIHDALLYLPEHRAIVERHLRNAFARYGVGVTVKHVSYEKNEDSSLHPLPITDKQGNGYASITTDSCCCHGLTAV